MRKQAYRSLRAAAFIFGLALAGCGGSDGDNGSAGGSTDLIDPTSQPSEVMESLVIRAGDNAETVLRAGVPPTKTGTDNDPSITAAEQSVSTPAGGDVDIPVDFDSGSALASLFVRVIGADSYAEITFSPGSRKVVESVALNIEVPTNIGSGEFCVEISGRDADGLVSGVDTVCITIDRSVLDALQGSWSFACSSGVSDDGTPESFSGSWFFSGTDVTVTESLYEGNTSCTGQASADSPYTEEFTISIGQETVADDGGPATELDIFEEGVLTDLCIVRVEQDRFLLGCEGQGEPRATTFNEGEFERVQTPVSSAKACFNPVLYDTGTEVVITERYTATDDDEGPTFLDTEVSESTQTVNTTGPTTVDGRSVISIRGSATAEDPAHTEYHEVDLAAPSFGVVGEDSDNGESIRYAPALVVPFNLAEGESLQYDITINEMTFDDGSQETSELHTFSGTYPATVTYVGREIVSVPAGNIETCHFDYLIAGGADDGEDDPFSLFYAVDTGLLVLWYEDSPTHDGVRTDQGEIIEASINGQRVH